VANYLRVMYKIIGMSSPLSITEAWPVRNSYAWQLMTFKNSARAGVKIRKRPPLRVLHLLSQQPGKTGSGVYLQALVLQGAKANIAQRIIAGIAHDSPVPAISPLNSSDIRPVRFGAASLPFPVAGMSDVMPYESTRFSDFTQDMLDAYLDAFAEAMTAEVKSFEPDIIHSHHLWLATALARALFPSVPLVTTCHGTEIRQLELVPELSVFVIPACSGIDRVMALHENHVGRISRLYGMEQFRITCVGAGYRDDIFCPTGSCSCIRKQKQELTVVYAGKLSRAKGLPWLIEAAARVEPPAGKKVRFLIAGSGGGDEAKQIHDMAGGLQDRIRFLGALSQEELSSVLKDADIFVLPSFYEGLPLVVLEAVACCCRGVVTELPGIHHWLPEKLVKSGIVELVPLPKLIGPDVPDPSGLPRFTEDIAAAVERQLHRCGQDEPDWEGEITCTIESMNWQGVFSRVKKVYKQVLKDF
jgi:glycosyltransferase involved in cell wall biosynthesis